MRSRLVLAPVLGLELALVLVLALVAVACAAPFHPSRAPWTPTRHEYGRFRDAHPDRVLDPNYLPFMTHRFEDADPDSATADWLILCRWDTDRFPLRVYVDPPEIAEEIQDEFRPVRSQVYMAAVRRALASWEAALPDVVRFESASEPDDADLRIRLVGAAGPAPDPDVQVLGITPIARACRVRGPKGPGRLDVEFEVDQIAVYIADRFGLLTDDQVERIALHELGHALGMRGHSPIPADVMYEVARDRTVERLSPEDVNSFRSLYALPNGTVFGRLPRPFSGAALERPVSRAPTGAPTLDARPHRDERLGFSVRMAEGWLRIATPYGVVGVDGVAWDYEASFQLIVRAYPTVASYLERYEASHIGRGWVRRREDLEVAGYSGLRLTVEQPDASLFEQHVFLETGDGRLVVAIADAPVELFDDFQPWFQAMLESVEIFPTDGPRPDAGAPSLTSPERNLPTLSE